MFSTGRRVVASQEKAQRHPLFHCRLARLTATVTQNQSPRRLRTHRRSRLPYKPEEEIWLREGVARHGKAWNVILNTYQFQPATYSNGPEGQIQEHDGMYRTGSLFFADHLMCTHPKCGHLEGVVSHERDIYYS